MGGKGLEQNVVFGLPLNPEGEYFLPTLPIEELMEMDVGGGSCYQGAKKKPLT